MNDVASRDQQKFFVGLIPRALNPPGNVSKELTIVPRAVGMSLERSRITVYYDGACPSCVKDRRNYERLAGANGDDVVWVDITGKDDELRECGIDPHKALTELHVKDENRKIRSELDAYIVLMSKVLVLKPLAWFI